MKYVTVEECEKKPHVSKGLLITLITIVIGLFGLFITLVGYSSNEAWAAANKVDQVAERTNEALDQLKRAAITNEKAIELQKQRYDTFLTKLDDICAELKYQREDQRKIFDKMIEIQSQK